MKIIDQILPACLADNLTARVLDSDGNYSYALHGRDTKGFSAQAHLNAPAHDIVDGWNMKSKFTGGVNYTKTAERAAPAELAVPAEDVQDFLNATV